MTPALLGVSHLSFSVPDMGRAADFWIDVLGFEALNDDAAYRFLFHRQARIAVVLSDHGGTVGGQFDERNPGLDHIALAVSDIAELERWADSLTAATGLRPEIVESDAGWHLNFRAPDNFPIELFVLNSETAGSLGVADVELVAAASHSL